MTNEEIEEFMKIRLEEGLPEPETLDAPCAGAKEGGEAFPRR